MDEDDTDFLLFNKLLRLVLVLKASRTWSKLELELIVPGGSAPPRARLRLRPFLLANAGLETEQLLILFSEVLLEEWRGIPAEDMLLLEAVVLEPFPVGFAAVV